MKRLERLFALNETLRRRQRAVPVPALAEQFGVSERTIERDLASLRAAGVPLYGEVGRNGGNRTLEPTSHRVAFSAPEIVALLAAVKAAGPGAPFADASAAATKKLVDVLPPGVRSDVDALRSRLRTPVGATAPARIRRTIEEAVRRRVAVNIGYRDRNDLVTDRKVEAVGLFLGRTTPALIGHCLLRDAGRLFRLDRITSARLTTRANEHHDVDAVLGFMPFDLETL